MSKLNDTTRRYPRSTEEAFGCDGDWFYEHEDDRHWVDKAVRWVSYFGFAVLAVYFFK